MTLEDAFGASTIVSSDKLHRRKEQLKKEIQEIREKIVQYELEMSMIQSNQIEYVRTS
jgi:hypothetical protein